MRRCCSVSNSSVAGRRRSSNVSRIRHVAVEQPRRMKGHVHGNVPCVNTSVKIRQSPPQRRSSARPLRGCARSAPDSRIQIDVRLVTSGDAREPRGLEAPQTPGTSVSAQLTTINPRCTRPLRKLATRTASCRASPQVEKVGRRAVVILRAVDEVGSHRGVDPVAQVRQYARMVEQIAKALPVRQEVEGSRSGLALASSPTPRSKVVVQGGDLVRREHAPEMQEPLSRRGRCRLGSRSWLSG